MFSSPTTNKPLPFNEVPSQFPYRSQFLLIITQKMTSMKVYALLFVSFFLSGLMQLAHGQATETSRSVDGKMIDQGIAYVLVLIAITVTYCRLSKNHWGQVIRKQSLYSRRKANHSHSRVEARILTSLQWLRRRACSPRLSITAVPRQNGRSPRPNMIAMAKTQSLKIALRHHCNTKTQELKPAS